MMMKRKIILTFVIIIGLCFFSLFVGCNERKRGGSNMNLTSSSFSNGDMIPSKYSCDGENISPPLTWTDIPEGTKTFALICDDPDAPAGDWVHWIMYDIPVEVHELPENIEKIPVLDNRSVQGKNDFRKIGYDGPCPPDGVHRYFFKIYALDLVLQQKPGLTKHELFQVIKGHVLGEGQLMVKYGR